MNRSLYLLLITSLLFSGCANGGGAYKLISITHRIKGEYYLDARKYDAGIAYFIAEIAENPDSAGAHYYLGRLYLGNDTYASGLRHLKRAVALDPMSADHQFWLGVAHGALEQPIKEREHYLKALSIHPRHQRALTYIGHNYLRDDVNEKALEAYDRALDLNPGNPAALYNRALALQRLGRTAEEKAAWKSYLSRFPTSPFARNATRHLNRTGDFEYRNHLIGRRNIPFRSIAFAASSSELHTMAKASLDQLGYALRGKPDLTLHVIVYLKNNTGLAKERANVIRNYILKRYPEIPPTRIKLSWFGAAEKIDLEGKHYTLNESVNFFTVY